MSLTKESISILDLFHEKRLVKICAPMVRYSKLQFRNLVKLYDCDLNFTPMILADSFCKSNKARNNEFTTNCLDTPLITQFAANTVQDFVGAAYLASPFCNGADLNCGCPQRWAREQGLGCEMLRKPELVFDIVRQCRNTICKPFTVSVKMRILKDDRETVEICRKLEKCDVSFITVHGRTASQRLGDVNKDTLKLIKQNCSIPVVANGGVTSLDECIELYDYTGCEGVMVANGLLTNPTLFSGNSITSVDCIQKWLDICYNSSIEHNNYNKEKEKTIKRIPEKPYNLTFQMFHHHLVFMLEKLLPKKERQYFNNLKTFKSVITFLNDYFHVVPNLFESKKFSEYSNFTIDYSDRDIVYKNLKPADTNIDNFNVYETSSTDGKYFTSKTDADSCDWSNLFIENG